MWTEADRRRNKRIQKKASWFSLIKEHWALNKSNEFNFQQIFLNSTHFNWISHYYFLLRTLSFLIEFMNFSLYSTWLECLAHALIALENKKYVLSKITIHVSLVSTYDATFFDIIKILFAVVLDKKKKSKNIYCAGQCNSKGKFSNIFIQRMSRNFLSQVK